MNHLNHLPKKQEVSYQENEVRIRMARNDFFKASEGSEAKKIARERVSLLVLKEALGAKNIQQARKAYDASLTWSEVEKIAYVRLENLCLKEAKKATTVKDLDRILVNISIGGRVWTYITKKKEKITF
jgi:hypothetical protein